MAIKTLSIICRRMTALDKNLFSYNDSKYKFAGWSTTRERANNGIIDYADQASLSVANDEPLELYASWKVRDTKYSYKDLSITSQNVAYDQVTAPINYTITLLKTYEGLDMPYALSILTNDEPLQSDPPFGTNGVPGTENATQARTVTVSYTHPDSGLVATTDIVLGGYTPIFKIICLPTPYGKLICTQNGKQVAGISNEDGTITYTSTNKNFTLSVSANEYVENIWIAKKSCALYGKNYSALLAHAAIYPKSNSCGSWTTIKTKLYGFSSWSGPSIDGNTNATVTVVGSVLNPPMFAANFKRIPLLQNTVIGDWRPVWITTKTETYLHIAYKTNYTWVPTCNTGRKYLKKYGISTMHEGKSGHGYYLTSTTPYIETRTRDIPINHTNLYFGASHVDAPYTLYIPENGILKIKGKYGINVYGCTCKKTGGFKILKYSETQNVYDDFLDFNATFNKSDEDFYKEITVKKGERYQFSATYSSSALKHIAVWIDTIELAETT